MKKILFVVSLLLLPILMNAQELNCKVSVVYRSIQTTNTQIFGTLEGAIEEFMNGRKWTGDVFQPAERIECNIIINLTKMTNNENFQGTISIQARRPVYKSAYNSQLINFIDKNFNFNYIEYDPIVFNENSFDSNLSGVLAFYAYVILGLDYDSFAPSGGTVYFQKAENIVQKAQNAAEVGWKPMESKKNRYWLMEQLLHPDYEPFREYFYQYHRNGLDLMVEDPKAGIATIVDKMNLLEPVHEKRPSSLVYQMFFDTKFQEIMDLVKPLENDMRLKAATILKKVDPQHAQDYLDLTKG